MSTRSTKSTRVAADAGRPCPRRLHYLGLAVGATLLAVYGSLVPLDYHALDLAEALRRFRQIPFLSLGIDSRADFVANILLFIPLGFGWLGAWTVDQRQRAKVWLAGALVVVGCALLSVALEFSQLWFPPRTVSQNDIVAETIGSIVGVVLWVAAGQALTEWVRTYTSTSRAKTQIVWLLEFYFLGLLVYSLMPFDLTIRPSELLEKYRQGKIELIPFAGMPEGSQFVYAVVCDFLLFVPVGLLIATWRTPAGRPCRGIAVSLAMGAAVALVIEMAQLLVYSRFTATGDIIVDTAGALAGIALARWWCGAAAQEVAHPATGHRGGIRMAAWLVAAALYAALLVVVFWTPFEILHDVPQWRARYEGFWAVPFARLYCGSEFHALNEILRKVLFFSPLGGLLAAAGCAPRLPSTIRRLLLSLLLMLATGFGVALELGQVFLVGHYADSTDAVLYATGAALGMFCVNRVLYMSQSGYRDAQCGDVATGAHRIHANGNCAIANARCDPRKKHGGIP